MAWDESFICDICGNTKLASNHWWLVSLGDVFCFEEGQPSRHFTMVPWDSGESRNPKIHHICGEGCATKALERFMSSGTLSQEVSRAAARPKPHLVQETFSTHESLSASSTPGI